MSHTVDLPTGAAVRGSRPALREHRHSAGVSDPATSAPQSARILRTEPPTPLPDGLIGDFDTPAGQQVLHVSEAEREAMT